MIITINKKLFSQLLSIGKDLYSYLNFLLYMLHQHHHHFWWKLLPGKEINQIYLSVALRSFALSLISLFVPMYLYSELGYSLQETLAFYIIFSVVAAITCPFAAKFASKYGLKHSILLSVPFQVSYFYLLYQLSSVNIPLALIASLEGLAIAFFWMGMHLEFCKISHKKHRGEEVGKRQAAMVLATLAGPLAGGAMIKFFNFGVVFVIASLMLLLSAAFLFLSKERHVKFKFSVKSLWTGSYFKNSLFFTYRGILVAANAILWPLFMFITLNDYLSLGVIGSIAGLATAILSLIMGKISDTKISKRSIIRFVAPIESITWFFRGFLATFSGFLGISIVQSIVYGIRSAPMGALVYDQSKSNPVEFFVTREIFICLGRIFVLSVILISMKFVPAFILVGLSSFAVFLF